RRGNALAIGERDGDVFFLPHRAFGRYDDAVLPVHAGGGQARPGVNGHNGSARRRDGVGELVGQCSDAGARVSHVITWGSRVVCALEGCTARGEHTTSQVVREEEDPAPSFPILS